MASLYHRPKGRCLTDEKDKKQYLIENKFTVDAFLEEIKLVIQFDGDYWHGFKKDKNGNLDKRKKKRIDLDKSQDAYMRKKGYEILRFWEHEIYKEEENVIKLIINKIIQYKT